MPAADDYVLLASADVVRHAAGRLREAVPEARFVAVDDDGVHGDPRSATVAYFSLDLLPDRAERFASAVDEAPSMRWFHTCSAGVDAPWFQSLLGRGLRFTTSSGASAAPIAQTVLYYLLALSRNARRWEDAQRRRAWEPHDVIDLRGKGLCVVGMGPIGTEVARLAGALGMDVTGVRRRPRGTEPCPTVGVADLDSVLPRTDFLVLAAPLNAQTRHMIDASRLALLPRGAFVINVGRGALVDEESLIEALAGGRLGGAALDVFETEPLPAASPLWAMPDVIVTPHACGRNPGNDERSLALLIENSRRWVRGEPLINEISRPRRGQGADRS